MIQEGHDVHLFSLNYKNLIPDVEDVNGIRVYRYATNSLLYKSSALAYEFGYYHRRLRSPIRSFINEIKPDALHVHDMLLAKAVIDVNDKYFNLPLTLDLHENRPEIMKFYPHLKKFPAKYLVKPKLWVKQQNILIKRADKVVMVTPEAIDIAINDTGEHINKFLALANTIVKDIYFNYPVNSDFLKALGDGFKIVYLGDTGIRRGTDTAIRAMKLVREESPNAKLILVGKSTEDTYLKELVNDLDLTDNVLFEGWKDVSLFPSYVESADVCISPLHRNLHHDTTLANKIFQYMAGGRPLIVSDCPPQKRIVESEGCGLIFPGGDHVALADSILELNRNANLAESMGRKAKAALLEKYTWNHTAKDLILHYQELENSKIKKV